MRWSATGWDASGIAGVAGQRVVLTGGACQLTGVRELATQMLDKQIRIGRPLGVTGLAEATGGGGIRGRCGPAALRGRRPGRGPDARGRDSRQNRRRAHFTCGRMVP